MVGQVYVSKHYQQVRTRSVVDSAAGSHARIPGSTPGGGRMYTFFIQCIKFSFILSICRAFAKPVQVPSRIVSEGIYGMVVKCSSSTQVRRVRVPDSAVHIFLFDFDSRANERGKTNICCTGISGDLLGLPVPRVTRSPKTAQNRRFQLCFRNYFAFYQENRTQEEVDLLDCMVSAFARLNEINLHSFQWYVPG